MSSVINWLRNQDVFGQPVQLNFNRNGPNHKTVFGGVVSIFSTSLLLVYMGIYLDKMINYRDDKISLIANSLNFKEQGTLKFSDLNFIPIAGIINGKLDRPWTLDAETFRHITIRWEQWAYDYSKGIYPHVVSSSLAR